MVGRRGHIKPTPGVNRHAVGLNFQAGRIRGINVPRGQRRHQERRHRERRHATDTEDRRITRRAGHEAEPVAGHRVRYPGDGQGAGGRAGVWDALAQIVEDGATARRPLPAQRAGRREVHRGRESRGPPGGDGGRDRHLGEGGDAAVDHEGHDVGHGGAHGARRQQPELVARHGVEGGPDRQRGGTCAGEGRARRGIGGRISREIHKVPGPAGAPLPLQRGRGTARDVRREGGTESVADRRVLRLPDKLRGPGGHERTLSNRVVEAVADVEIARRVEGDAPRLVEAGVGAQAAERAGNSGITTDRADQPIAEPKPPQGVITGIADQQVADGIECQPPRITEERRSAGAITRPGLTHRAGEGPDGVTLDINEARYPQGGGATGRRAVGIGGDNTELIAAHRAGHP